VVDGTEGTATFQAKSLHLFSTSSSRKITWQDVGLSIAHHESSERLELLQFLHFHFLRSAGGVKPADSPLSPAKVAPEAWVSSLNLENK
jgi:hypothetical protein